MEQRFHRGFTAAEKKELWDRWKRGEFAEGDPEFAAISAVALRHNDISNVLTTAPDRFELMHRRKPNGDVDPLP